MRTVSIRICLSKISEISRGTWHRGFQHWKRCTSASAIATSVLKEPLPWQQGLVLPVFVVEEEHSVPQCHVCFYEGCKSTAQRCHEYFSSLCKAPTKPDRIEPQLLPRRNRGCLSDSHLFWFPKTAPFPGSRGFSLLELLLQDGALSISKQLPLSLRKLYLNWKDWTESGQCGPRLRKLFCCARISNFY